VNNEKILEEFFQALRVTLTTAFSYSKDHPYFIKSVENFKLKTEDTLLVLSPLKVGITSSELMVNGESLTKGGFYNELAHLLHQRKIKSIEITSGASVEELVQFFSVISLPQKEILKAGGVNAILGKDKIANIVVDELDYSVFLQGGGKECTDIWGYMLKDAVQRNDSVKLNEVADNFGTFIEHSNENDIVGGEEVPESINEFLTCLKDKNKEKFDKCSREVFLWLLRNKNSLDEEKLSKLKLVFNSLEHEDFSTLLWDGLIHEDNFDAISLQLFSKISEQKNAPKIAEGFFNKINQSQNLKDNPNVVKKIQDLLGATQGTQLSAVYYNTLKSLIKGISPSGVMAFDQEKLKENYRYIVLSMLSFNDDEDNLKLAAGIMELEFASALEDNAFGFLKDLHRLLLERKKEGIAACIDLEKKFSAFIEDIVLNKSLAVEQEFLIEMVSSPAQEIDVYLDRIFNDPEINRHVLILFFRLFPENLELFYQRLAQKLQDMEFLHNFVLVLGQFDAPISLGILEYIYSLANELVKLEVLKVMRKLEKIDSVFLVGQLNTDSFLLRKNLCSILSLAAQSNDAVLNSLFEIRSPFGRKNVFLLENMQIVFDLKFIEAVKNLRNLSHRRFFWNRKLRNRAKQILKEWNVL